MTGQTEAARQYADAELTWGELPVSAARSRC